MTLHISVPLTYKHLDKVTKKAKKLKLKYKEEKYSDFEYLPAGKEASKVLVFDYSVDLLEFIYELEPLGDERSIKTAKTAIELPDHLEVLEHGYPELWLDEEM